MHSRLAGLQHRPEYRHWEQRLSEARQRLAEQSDLLDRELFYAIQPESRLKQLIDQYRAHFS
jgi:hypothetical protein